MIDQPVNACATFAPAVLASDEVPLDDDTFALLYERHLPGVYRYISSRVASREEAEDLTSDAFRAAWSSRRAYSGRGTFRAWLFCIVRRTLADYYRGGRRSATVLEDQFANRLPDGAPTPEEEALRQEQHRATRRLLAALNPQQQEVLSLRFAAELTYPEIAIVIGKREEAVKKIAQRALEALRGRYLHAQSC